MQNYFASNSLIQKLFVIPSILFVFGCATISSFDQQAYMQSTSIKVDALNMMDSATGRYQLQQAQVMQVMTAVNKAYAYEKNRPKNTITVKMWSLLKDTTGHLLGGFIKRWQREGSLDTTFIRDAKVLVEQSFDQIAQLESGKIKSSQINNQ